MWIEEKRLRRDKRVFGWIIAGNCAALVVVVVQKEIEYLIPVIVGMIAAFGAARVLTRCVACRTSVIWWWLTKADARASLVELLNRDQCPTCGFGRDGPTMRSVR
jgi:hypothetical protein